MKKSFLLYCDQSELVNKLSDIQAGVLFKHIFWYCCNNFTQPEIDDPLVDIVFTSIRTSIERDHGKYLNVVKRNQINGKKGGRPKDGDLLTETGKIVPKSIKKGHFIYLIEDITNNEFKIGETQNLFKRRYDIKRPTNNLLIWDFSIMSARKCQALERKILKDYSDYSLGGDWLDLNIIQANEIVKLFMPKNPVGSSKTQGIPENPSEPDSDSDSDNVNDSDKEKKTSLKDYLQEKIIENGFIESKDKIFEFYKYRQAKPAAKRYKTEIGLNALFRDLNGCREKGFIISECLQEAMEREWQTPNPEYFKNNKPKNSKEFFPGTTMTEQDCNNFINGGN